MGQVVPPQVVPIVSNKVFVQKANTCKLQSMSVNKYTLISIIFLLFSLFVFVFIFCLFLQCFLVVFVDMICVSIRCAMCFMAMA